MTKTVQLKEYTKLSKSKLNCCDLGALEKYLERNNLSSALKITASGIKAKHHVGVIKFKQTQFEILPKLISKGIDCIEFHAISQNENDEPAYVLLASLACSPNASSIALANVLKSI